MILVLIYEFFNTLQWQLSSSDDVMDITFTVTSVLIATVNASTTSYQDHDQPLGVTTLYGVAAFDSDGNMSTQATVTIG